MRFADELRSRTAKPATRKQAVPGSANHAHVAATDEHDEDGVLISDEFTNPHITIILYSRIRVQSFGIRYSSPRRKEHQTAASAVSVKNTARNRSP